MATIMEDFRAESQKLREKYGAMEDTAPLLWDLNCWLSDRLRDEAEIRNQINQACGRN